MASKFSRIAVSHVSIPFKRESGFKVSESDYILPIPQVSIPFKRESGFKGFILLKNLVPK